MRDSVSDSIAATGMLIVKRRSSVLSCSICVDMLSFHPNAVPAFAQSFQNIWWLHAAPAVNGKLPPLRPRWRAAEAIMVVRMEDSNPHTLRRWNLNPVRLPIPPHSLNLLL